MALRFNRFHVFVIFLLALTGARQVRAGDPDAARKPAVASNPLEEEIRQQRERIAQLERIVQQQGALLESLKMRLVPVEASAPSEAPGTGPLSAAVAGSPEVSPEQDVEARVSQVEKKVDTALRSIGGFRFSGDFRYRLDAQLRSSNQAAGPVQNVRSRYRLRLNVDKEWDRRFRFRMQLSTGPLNNGLTLDQDFAGTVARHPFMISEAYVDFRPTSKLSLRVGRMAEVFADNSRFLWDDDVRFNGFQQVYTIPLATNGLGFSNLEIRGGEYILSNPNIAVLSPASPFVTAGFEAGRKVPTASFFHPGVVVAGALGENWTHQITADAQFYRNPSQIQLASTASGFPVLVSNSVGIALSGPMTGTGNATTLPGGGAYSAPDFTIVHLGYRVEAKGIRLGGSRLPAWFDFQVSRNTAASKLRDAFMASANFGSVRKPCHVPLLYQFSIKDANALISQFTDDDLGTGSGVNIAAHALRFDLGLTSFLQWQNLLYIVNGRRSSNPAEQFFVPLSAGGNALYRYQGQLVFSF